MMLMSGMWGDQSELS